MRPTLLYSVVQDRNLTALYQSAARNLSLGTLVSCSTLAELEDYLLLHEKDPADPAIAAIAQYDALPDLRHWETLASEVRKRCTRFFALVRARRPASESIAASPVVFLPEPSNPADAQLSLQFVIRELSRAIELRDLQDAVRRLRHSGARAEDFSHAALMTFLDREWKRCMRYEWPISAVLLHLRCNGGRLIRSNGEIVGALSSAVHRPGDMIGILDRQGQEHIAAILSETGPEGAAHVARRLVDLARQLPFDLCSPPGLTIACGAATLSPLEIYRSGPPNPQLFEAADVLLEAAHARLEEKRPASD